MASLLFLFTLIDKTQKSTIFLFHRSFCCLEFYVMLLLVLRDYK